ncbi:MAG: hydrolase [Parcubacteria group bacterium]|nr:hydrolase [Parcubacteria group bacterium]
MSKWNGLGGKVDEGESIEQATIRELQEEILVSAEPSALERRGHIDFYFVDKPEWSQRVHIFLIKKWEGEPIETEEMAPRWFALKDIPYEEMWVSDTYWLPQVLEGKSVHGELYFAPDGSVARHQIGVS